MSDYARRGATIDSQQAEIATSLNESATLTNKSANSLAATDKLDRRSQLLQVENATLRESLDALKRRAATEIRKLKSTVDSSKQKASAAAHAARAKETVIDSLKDRLGAELKKEKAATETTKEVFKALQHRKPRKGSPADTSALSIIGMYEGHKERADDELASLRSEVLALNEALREKENRAMRRDFEGMVEKEVGGEERRREREREERREERREEKKAGEAREASAARKLARAEAKLAEARKQLGLAQDENTNMLLELNSRPTVKQQRVAEKRIDELERKLYAAVEAASEQSDVRELRKMTGTKALIGADKLNHRLRLERLDAIPREISKEILKEACRELEVSDVTLIAPCIRKMSKAMLLLPRLERFVNDVCGFVLKAGDGGGGGGGGKRSMEEVMPILKKWEKQVDALGKSQEFKAIVIGEVRETVA